MHRFTKIPLLLFSLLVISITISALVVEKATLEEITEESQAVVYGKVINKISVWEGKQINTYLTLEVYDVAKGEGISNTLTVKQMGGTVGAYSDEVSGSPKYEIGDEVFFFLVDWKGNYWIHSIALGGYAVIETGGVKYAVNGFNDIEFTESLYKKPGEDLKGEYTLFDLTSKVKSLTVKE
jgi:hypothetical protein